MFCRAITPVFLALGVSCALASPAAADGEVWLNLTPAGPNPPGTRDFGLAYDSQADRMILAGTNDGHTWIYNFTGTPGWTAISPTPPPIGNDRALYDPVNNRVVLVTTALEVYTLDLANPTAWVKLVTSGTPPPPRSFFAITRDDQRNRLLLFGGGPYTGLYNDVWALALTGSPQWTQITPTGTPPAPRWGPVAVYDNFRDRLLIMSGSTSADYATTNDVWTISLSSPPTWVQLTSADPRPPVRLLAAAIYDSTKDRLLVCGGYGGAQDDVWAMDGGSSAWSLVNTSGTSAGLRWSHEAVYRSASPHQMVIFGGWNGSALNDTRALFLTSPDAPPVLFGFSPLGGQIGDPVMVSGQYLSTTTAIRFNGVDAPILSAQFGSLTTRVPAGATTGPIQVVTSLGSAQSPSSFFVGVPPVITAAIPDSGRADDTIELHGAHFTATTKVMFGGTGSASFAVVSDTLMSATIDTLAKSGAISVTTLAATGTSSFDFLLLPDDPRPRLLGVHDVAADQGGRVILTWRRSDFDKARYKTIKGYRIWRRVPSATPTAATRGSLDPRRRLRQTGDWPDVFWEAVADLPAAFLRGYGYTATTPQDSMASGNPYTAFFVEAFTSDPGAFYESSVDSGYSVDNLAPPAPMPFTATYGRSAVALHWSPSRAADFGAFHLYRGASATFVPAANNLVFAGRDTGYVDVTTSGSYYKLAAIDVHGNVSRYALVSPTNPVATLASLVSSQWTGREVSLLWYGAGLSGEGVNVYRREGLASWSLVAQPLADGEGFVRCVDPGVQPGHAYAYRLGILDGDTEQFAGETSIEIPAGHLGLIAVTPNPVRGGQLAFAATLASAEPATVRVLDMAGRVVREQAASLDLSGTFTLPLSGGTRMRPGVYFLELRQGRQRAIARFVYLE